MAVILAHGGSVWYPDELTRAGWPRDAPAYVCRRLPIWKALFEEPAIVCVHEASFGDEEALQLLHLRGITRLELQNTSVTNGSLVYFCHFRRLRSLNVSRTAVTAAGLRYLEECPIEELYLNHLRLGNDDLRIIAQFRELRDLWLDDNELSDDAMPHLDRMRNLERLSLLDTHVTANGLASLSIVRRLRVLNVSGAMSEEEIASLAESLPHCIVNAQLLEEHREIRNRRRARSGVGN